MVCQKVAWIDDDVARHDLWVCETTWDWARLLVRLSQHDEDLLAVRMLASAFANTERLKQPAAIQAWVQANIRYVPDDPPGKLLGWIRRQNQAKPGEPFERFRSPEETIAEGEGDCDDSARLIRAVLRALGWDARLGFFGTQTDPEHVVCYVRTEDGEKYWLEGTIAAEPGEEPYDARRRLDGR